MKVSCRFLIFDESLGYAYSSGFKPCSIKSGFEPITPPLKWVLADAACKVSMIFFNIASGLCWELHNGVKFLIFIRVFGFSRLRVKSFGCSLINSVNGIFSLPYKIEPPIYTHTPWGPNGAPSGALLAFPNFLLHPLGPRESAAPRRVSMLFL